jgi:hypothetical protein
LKKYSRLISASSSDSRLKKIFQAHFGVLMSGKIKVWMDDKSELTIEAGQSYYIPPGKTAIDHIR